jgi:hypothetical protein
LHTKDYLFSRFFIVILRKNVFTFLLHQVPEVVEIVHARVAASPIPEIDNFKF